MENFLKNFQSESGEPEWRPQRAISDCKMVKVEGILNSVLVGHKSICQNDDHGAQTRLFTSPGLLWSIQFTFFIFEGKTNRWHFKSNVLVYIMQIYKRSLDWVDAAANKTYRFWIAFGFHSTSFSLGRKSGVDSWILSFSSLTMIYSVPFYVWYIKGGNLSTLTWDLHGHLASVISTCLKNLQEYLSCRVITQMVFEVSETIILDFRSQWVFSRYQGLSGGASVSGASCCLLGWTCGDLRPCTGGQRA